MSELPPKFVIRVHGARGDRRGHGASDSHRGSSMSNWGYDSFDGRTYSAGVVHVKDGIALTPEGEAILKRAGQADKKQEFEQ